MTNFHTNSLNDYLRECPICGGIEFGHNDILWPELISEWQLHPDEVRLINNQQGICCKNCGSNLISMTLAEALNNYLGWKGTLNTLILNKTSNKISLLEINEAGNLTKYLSKFKNYTFAKYPQIDMQKMDLPDSNYDIVVHSDTLEHIPDPVKGLVECRRVLRPGGAVIMTIPILPTRLTRRRFDLPPSFHGRDSEKNSDFLVYTEYGADFYIDFIKAGWHKITLFTLGTSDSFALIGKKF